MCRSAFDTTMSQSDGGEPPPPASSSEDSAVLDACARAAAQYYSPRRGRAKTIDGELLQATSAEGHLDAARDRDARRATLRITGDPDMRICKIVQLTARASEARSSCGLGESDRPSSRRRRKGGR